MDPSFLWLIVFIALSAFFSGSEMSFSSLSRTKLKTLSQNGDKRAKTALSLSEHFDSLLSTLLVGNNIVNIAASSLATVLFTKWLGETEGPVLSTVVMTILILIFGEITPKTLAKENPEKTAMRFGGVLRVLHTLFTPINALFSLWKRFIRHLFKVEIDNSITEEELITIIDEAEEVGSLDKNESELIRSAIEFNDVNVENILTPRVDMVAIAADTPIEEIGELFRTQHFSRLPVYSDTLDHIVGILHEKDFNTMLYEKRNDLEAFLHTAVFVPEKMKTSRLLSTFQKAKVHMAIAVDEFGGTAGLVTLEDVLEGLVGEIWDEHDEVIEEYKPLGDNRYLIACSAQFDTIAEKLHFEDEENESATIGGWVQKELGKSPEVSDSFTFDNLFVEVTRAEHHRALEIRVSVTPKETDEDGKERAE